MPSLFAVSTERILAWPMCKYQAIMHEMVRKQELQLLSESHLYQFFEFLSPILFACQPDIYDIHDKLIRQIDFHAYWKR